MDTATPSQSAVDGRDNKGRFAAGNKLSRGNVIARKAAQCRAKLFSTVSTRDFQAIVKRVVADAKAGESWACKLLFAYMLGDPQQYDTEERLARLEESLRKDQK